ncbi:MAG TPA: hypothetical protein VNV41_19080 [Candidatus Acidoferrales bacterium]|nr:hypothetical protein [Candidatus Acidoferrales bacterium]
MADRFAVEHTSGHFLRPLLDIAAALGNTSGYADRYAVAGFVHANLFGSSVNLLGLLNCDNLHAAIAAARRFSIALFIYKGGFFRFLLGGFQRKGPESVTPT